MFRWSPILLAVAVLALSAPVQAAEKEIYVVQMTSPPLARIADRAGARGKLDADSPASRLYVDSLLRQHGEALAALGAQAGRKVTALRQFTNAFNGMAIELTREEAGLVSRVPGVLRVEPRRTLHPMSDAGPAWVGAPDIWDGTQTGGLPGTQGEGVVIGVIDSGINMDHPSFADVGGDGYNHTNPRGSGNYLGWCNPSNPDYDPALVCNDKLIGAWSFSFFSEASPEDEHGHGTQMAGIAAGNHITIPLTETLQRQISGVAPHASLVVYNVCEPQGCFTDAALGAIDQAVLDGVDVMTFAFSDAINISPWTNQMSVALLGAREAGIFVAIPASTGGFTSANIPPVASAPWLLTVGASTHDRRFSSSLTELSGGSTTPPWALDAVALTDPYGPALIVDAAAHGDEHCYAPFPAGTLTGKIVVCSTYDGLNGRLQVSNARAGGAAAVVLAHADNSDDVLVDPTAYQSPVVLLYEKDGGPLRTWLASGSGHTARIPATVLDVAASHGDVVAGFSSRGPGTVPSLLKPNVLAPGAGILAPSIEPGGFAVGSGTSQASAAAAGSAALLIALHPTWTQAEVQSALETTAERTGLKLEDGTAAVSPFNLGSGRIDLGASGRAGLVLDETAARFAQADPLIGGDPSTLNLASLAADRCTSSCSWTRTVRSTLSSNSTWTASVAAPPGTTATVVPNSFTLGPGGTRTIQITLNGPATPLGWAFGLLQLTESASQAPPVKLPIATRWVPLRTLTVVKSGSGAGTVTSSPAGIACGPDCTETYPDEAYVLLAAHPAPGSTFAGWSGCTHIHEPCDVNLYSDRVVTASFEIKPGSMADGSDFHTVAPCRLVDTRTSQPFEANQSRSFQATGQCGIPATARALALNVTAVGATSSGFLVLYPPDLTVPMASTINFPAATVKANNAIARLSTNGEGRIGVYAMVNNGGVVHLLLDVAGYFE